MFGGLGCLGGERKWRWREEERREEERREVNKVVVDECEAA